MDSIPGLGTKILHTVQCGQKKILKRKKKSFFNFFFCMGVELINYVVIVSGEQ